MSARASRSDAVDELELLAFGEWYQAGLRRRRLRSRGLSVPFDPTFAPAGGGWERLPAGFVGPPELVLLGIPLRWQEYPRLQQSARTLPPPAEYVSRFGYGDDQRLQFVEPDESPLRFRHA